VIDVTDAAIWIVAVIVAAVVLGLVIALTGWLNDKPPPPRSR
jgi:VIT1/CCC1 family predicted Fe2+/Mn2+ transporter